MKKITAIIVAGGQGTRLRPLTNSIPKPMVKVVGKPILEHTLNLLKKHGATRFIFALCYLPQTIVDYFGDGSKFGVSISYTFEDPKKPLGTAGAILASKKFMKDSFIVTYADTLRDLDISKMRKEHDLSKNIATLNVYKHSGSNCKSLIEFDDTNKLTKLTELPAPIAFEKDDWTWSNGSVYIFEPEIFKYIKKGSPVDFARDVFPEILANKKPLSVFKSEGYVIDIGTPETLKRAEQDIQQGKISV